MIGTAPVWAVVLLGFFDSIVFPTIFALNLKTLGMYTKLGSSLLVMSNPPSAAPSFPPSWVSFQTTARSRRPLPFPCSVTLS
jgi:FHS family L-fucose permease-like MFS transporter